MLHANCCFCTKISIFMLNLTGEASMDHTNPDFVPSVFECIDPNQSPKKNAKRYVNKSFISKTTCILFTFDSKLSCCV